MADEDLALAWLQDENMIERVRIVGKTGRQRTLEHDTSGGLEALLRLLRDVSIPFSATLRIELAKAFDQREHGPRLRIIKPLRRRAGRPLGSLAASGSGITSDVEAQPEKIIRAKRARQRSKTRKHKT